VTTDELEQRLIDALTAARRTEPDGEDPDYGPHCRDGQTSADEHGVKRWHR
jgi:hypothetical protein